MPKIQSSRLIGPEDVKPGQFVTVAEVTEQYVYLPAEACVGGNVEPRVAAVTLRSAAAGWPFRVEQVSLPYVLVIAPDGERYAADLRRHRLARVRKRYGKAAFRLHEAAKATANADAPASP